MVLVIFVFLRNLSATIIPSLALPMSIVGTFAIMYPFGYSLDNLSLMALDPVRRLRRRRRDRHAGKHLAPHGDGQVARLQATFDGAREIGFTIVSMTLSLAAVFIPVLFMGGIIGRLLHEFAVTIVSAVLVSGFVSLSLTPMLCSRMLKPHHGETPWPCLRSFSSIVFDGMQDFYRRTLRTCLAHQRMVSCSHSPRS